MKTTIDAAGRIVIPRAIREQARLKAGGTVEVRLNEGIIEIEPAPLEVELVQRGDLVVAVPKAPPELLTQAEVNAVLRGLRENRLDAEA